MGFSVLQNLNYAAPYRGNLISSIFDLENKLKKVGVNMVYLFPDTARNIDWVCEMIKEGKSVYFKPESFWEKLEVFDMLIKKYNVHIVHTHFWCIPDMLCIRMLKLKNVGLKSIIHHHNHYVPSRSSFNEKIKRIIIRSDANIACSEDVAANLSHNNFNNVLDIENAIDFSRLSNQRNNNTSMFLMFGFDYYRKGVDIVLDAFDKLTDKYNNIQLGIVFAANKESGLANIKNRFGEIPSWLTVLPPSENISEYYAESKAFISASREEGFCYAIAEAAYCCCQSIISNIPGHRTDIPMIKVFENGNVAELAALIESVLNEDKEEIEKINAVQKEYVTEKYDLSSWSDGIIEGYRQLIGGEI